MEIANLISIDPKVHHSAPVITGTRVPVALVAGSLGGGMSKEEVMAEYAISKEQVEAALAYAADLVDATGVFSLSGA